MRAVPDANVLVAAYLTEGLCARLLRRARRGQFELITCAQILTETRENIQKLTSPSIEALNRDLLTLRTFGGIPIIPPRSFEALFTE